MSLIVFEGVDRCGKSTQIKMLANYLGNTPCEVIAFPFRESHTGKILDKFLTGEINLSIEEAHLLFAANRRGQEQRIRKLIQNGVIVILDRYYYSGTAYTLAQKELETGMKPDFEYIHWAKNADFGLPRPDITILLQLPLEKQLDRTGFGKERLEQKNIQTLVDKYMKSFVGENWLVVDASQSPEQIASEIHNSLPFTEELCLESSCRVV